MVKRVTLSTRTGLRELSHTFQTHLPRLFISGFLIYSFTLPLPCIIYIYSWLWRSGCFMYQIPTWRGFLCTLILFRGKVHSMVFNMNNVLCP